MIETVGGWIYKVYKVHWHTASDVLNDRQYILFPNSKLMGTNTLFWNDKKGMTKLESFVVIPKLWSGYILWGSQATTYITPSHIPHRVARKMDIFCFQNQIPPPQKNNIITSVLVSCKHPWNLWNKHPKNASQTPNCLSNKLTNHALILTDHFLLNWMGGGMGTNVDSP